MMNVMYASDNNYADIMGISIMSLLENNKSAKTICFYIVQDEISIENINKIKAIIQNYNREVVFINKPPMNEKLGVKLKTLRWSDSAYSRLFLKDIFMFYPMVEKVLYLDCDTLIVDSLEYLWNEDIDAHFGAACLECMSNVHKRIIGAKKTDNYINTGMLLLNVKRWIEEDAEGIICSFIRKYKGKTEYVDQGAINGTVGNYFKIVDAKYNLTSLAFDFTYEEMQIYRKPQFGYSKKDWEKAINKPAIIHFTTSFLSVRPWYKGSSHPYANQWKALYDASPWKEDFPRIMKNRKKRDKKEKLYKMLPENIAVHIAGFLHSYVKPIIYVLKSNLLQG